MRAVADVGQLRFVVLTIYMAPDLAEVARILQALVRLPLTVQRFNAHVAAVDVTGIGGLDSLPGPVMQLVVVGSGGSHELERTTKALNRLVGVYKVRVIDA
jgi:hypothetical protein